MLRGIRPLRLLRPLSSAIHVSPVYTAVVRVHDVVTLQGYRHGSPSSSPSSTSAEPRSIHARFSSREHRVLPRYLRPSPSSFILSGRVGGSGENLGAISICRLLCLVLSFSPPLSLSLSRSRSRATRPRFARLALSLSRQWIARLCRRFDIANPLPVRCREVPCRNGETREIEGFVASESRIESLRLSEDWMGYTPLDFRNVSSFEMDDLLFSFKVYYYIVIILLLYYYILER